MVESRYGPEEASGVWIYLERWERGLEGVSLELLGRAGGLARDLGTRVTGVMLGHDVLPLAQDAIDHGADRVIVADSPLLDVYSTDAYTEVLYDLVMKERPDIFLLGATHNGRDLAGRLAVRLRTGLTADCTELEIDKDSLLIGWVPGFGGGIEAAVRSPAHRPQMATVRPGVFPLPIREERQGTITTVHPDVKREIRSRRIEFIREDAPSVDLTKAKYIVAGGRGVNGDFSALRELAELIHGEVGATRVAVDEGWISREHQIGQTGVVTRPKLLIACGISGAVQFTVGVNDAEHIVAINTDPEAPIFEQADICVMGDANRIIPELTALIRKGGG